MASVDAVHARVKICMCVLLCTMLKRQSTLVKRSLFRLTGRDGASERLTVFGDTMIICNESLKVTRYKKKKVIRLHLCHYTNVAVYETWFDFDIRDANMHYVLEMSGLHKDLCW